MVRKQISKLFADSHNLASDVQTLADETNQCFEELQTENEDLKKRVDQLEKAVEGLQEVLQQEPIDNQPTSSKSNFKMLKREQLTKTTVTRVDISSKKGNHIQYVTYWIIHTV